MEPTTEQPRAHLSGSRIFDGGMTNISVNARIMLYVLAGLTFLSFTPCSLDDNPMRDRSGRIHRRVWDHVHRIGVWSKKKPYYAILRP